MSLIPPIAPGVLPIEPNIPPPGPGVESIGAPKTLRFSEAGAPKGLKSLTTRLGGEAAENEEDAGGEERTGEEDVGGTAVDVADGVADVRRGGRRPPGVYVKPAA